MSDWYAVSRKEVIGRGGNALFAYYHSLSQALQTLYPDYAWDASQFPGAFKAPRGYWQDHQSLRVALDVAEEKLAIEKVR